MSSSYTYTTPSRNGGGVNGLSLGHSPIINYRKDAKKGIKFTFMVVGESGTGKTTFINSLLNKKVLNHRYDPNTENCVGETKVLSFTSAKSVALPNTSILTRNEFNPRTIHEEPGIALTETEVEIMDGDVMKLYLNIIDTPGFGENLNNELCFIEIENYLKQQFDLVLAEETRIKRNPRFIDTRVHVMLYFITPTGHGLREIDIQCMKRLSKYVNIIPVIGKADSFTESELAYFKKQIRIDIEKFNVPTFQFDSYLNEYDEDEDFDLIEESKFLANLQPFAIITSEESFEINDPTTGQSKTIRARQYPWGLVDINDTKYSDFSILKSVILGSHLQDLKDLTHDFLYETYRTERLTKVTGVRALDDSIGAAATTEDDSEFHDTVEHQSSMMDNTIPSLSNLAQLTDNNTNQEFDNHSFTSSTHSIRKQRSMLLDDTEQDVPPQSQSSPKLPHPAFGISGSSLSLERSRTPTDSFKRLSIGPQRNQLRQISETVPYVIRHERILERQQKLEEMEMASAKELANRAAMLERKAAELKAKEKALLKQLELAKAKKQQEQEEKEKEEKEKEEQEKEEQEVNGRGGDEEGHEEEVEEEEEPLEEHQVDLTTPKGIEKDETMTDLHSIVSQK
ncbi:uncharacterized protein J8A68_006068 [[Candida] subhashii]|uniref:Septin-type G domain-containing protein n=1 Tax=[Candida] subhashii TaxID=561895 RepID=A0A8J5QDT6_9ASCO|nr:uncharacterized protein J8A68_006068 [[Candida] subhashii]KAG7660412.1 hypothetical protein J8A68_006068 [[Candida] subhashii]